MQNRFNTKAVKPSSVVYRTSRREFKGKNMCIRCVSVSLRSITKSSCTKLICLRQTDALESQFLLLHDKDQLP